MKRTLFSFLLLANLFLLAAVMPRTASAQYGCNGQYGNCPTSQSIVVDKLVGMPNATKGGIASCDGVDYRDNYSSSDSRFAPGSYVCFKIKVKNTSNVTLNDVVFKDYLPSYVSAVEGPGSFDANSRVISYTIGNMSSGAENVYYIKAQIAGQNQLPSNKGLMCLVNKAHAYNGTVSDEDTAQFCVEKQVTPGKVTPSSGPEFGMLLVAGSTLMAGAGIMLKRKTS